jgi:hypothetical protein
MAFCARAPISRWHATDVLGLCESGDRMDGFVFLEVNDTDADIFVRK